MISADFRDVAESARRLGRSRDTLLAHINKKQREFLEERGGSGTTNPKTGLKEYYEPGPDSGGGSPAGISNEPGGQVGGWGSANLGLSSAAQAEAAYGASNPAPGLGGGPGGAGNWGKDPAGGILGFFGPGIPGAVQQGFSPFSGAYDVGTGGMFGTSGPVQGGINYALNKIGITPPSLQVAETLTTPPVEQPEETTIAQPSLARARTAVQTSDIPGSFEAAPPGSITNVATAKAAERSSDYGEDSGLGADAAAATEGATPSSVAAPESTPSLTSESAPTAPSVDITGPAHESIQDHPSDIGGTTTGFRSGPDTVADSPSPAMGGDYGGVGTDYGGASAVTSGRNAPSYATASVPSAPDNSTSFGNAYGAVASGLDEMANATPDSWGAARDPAMGGDWGPSSTIGSVLGGRNYGGYPGYEPGGTPTGSWNTFGGEAAGTPTGEWGDTGGVGGTPTGAWNEQATPGALAAVTGANYNPMGALSSIVGQGGDFSSMNTGPAPSGYFGTSTADRAAPMADVSGFGPTTADRTALATPAANFGSGLADRTNLSFSYDSTPTPMTADLAATAPTPPENPFANAARRAAAIAADPTAAPVSGDWISRVPAPFRQQVIDAATQYGVPVNLFAQQMLVESQMRNPAIRGLHGYYVGLGQFNPPTARAYGLVGPGFDYRSDPNLSLNAAAHYMDDLVNTYGSYTRALAHYGTTAPYPRGGVMSPQQAALAAAAQSFDRGP